VYEPLKRLFDIAFACCALVAVSWLFVIAGLLILLEDRGPVFYLQSRTGKDGRPFRFIKLRTMVRNADALKAKLAKQNEASGPIFKIRRDPRITRTGRWLRRFSIDELPQFLNVLRGEMSIVGPRPLPMNEAARCNPLQQQRHLVKPGLLCFREVGGRSRLSFEEWMDLDLTYLRHRSLKTDFTILLRAIPAILRGDGAF
jgi:lipopolysaccharide/colanic/teichoic acid biosynthesis glycosyltransferase